MCPKPHFPHKPCNFYCTILRSILIFRNTCYTKTKLSYFWNPNFEILVQDCFQGEEDGTQLLLHSSQEPTLHSNWLRTLSRGAKKKSFGGKRQTMQLHIKWLTHYSVLHVHSYLHGPFPFVPQSREERDPSLIQQACHFLFTSLWTFPRWALHPSS